MSQPSDLTWVAPDSTRSVASPDPGVGSGPAVGYCGPAPLLVSVQPPARQNRLTIAFRLVLAIPHLVIAAGLAVAVFVVTLVSWFAGLFMGRLPERAHTFMTGALRWEFRAKAYLLFLTDAYPPFSLDDESYPVRLVTARTRLEWFVVLFRSVLLIPAWIVVILASYGLYVLSFFVWLVALVLGRLPQPLHQAVAAIVRLQMRFSAYAEMLTSEYPWRGLFGDAVTPANPAGPWRLPLSGAAKGLVSGILALGLAVIVTVVVVTGAVAGNSATPVASNAETIYLVEGAEIELWGTWQHYELAVQACNQLSCVTAQDHEEAVALRVFASSVSSAGVTGSAAADATIVVDDATAAARSLDKLAAATTAAQYQSDASVSPLQGQVASLNSDYTRLDNELQGSNVQQGSAPTGLAMSGV